MYARVTAVMTWIQSYIQGQDTCEEGSSGTVLGVTQVILIEIKKTVKLTKFCDIDVPLGWLFVLMDA